LVTPKIPKTKVKNIPKSFKFTEYAGDALLATIRTALAAYKDQPGWQSLMRNGMSKDFSWDASAREYVKVYERVRHLRAAVAA
jgi:starch synthase